MSKWVDPQSHVVPAARLAGSLIAGLLLAAVGGMVLGEYTFQGAGIQWLAIAGGVGLGAVIAWVLNRVWGHEPPKWLAAVAAPMAIAGEALAGAAAAYGVHSAHRLAAEKRAKQG